MGNHHIDQEIMEKFLSGYATEEEKIEIFTHASSCEFCSERLMALSEREQPMAMTRNLKESILMGTERVILKSPRKQFWFYSMKVCAAMCAALIILFASSAGEMPLRESPRTNVNVQKEMPKPKKSLTEKLGGAVDGLTWKIYTEIYS